MTTDITASAVPAHLAPYDTPSVHDDSLVPVRQYCPSWCGNRTFEDHGGAPEWHESPLWAISNGRWFVAAQQETGDRRREAVLVTHGDTELLRVRPEVARSLAAALLAAADLLETP